MEKRKSSVLSSIFSSSAVVTLLEPVEGTCTRCRRSNHFIQDCRANKDINDVVLEANPSYVRPIKKVKISKTQEHHARKEKLHEAKRGTLPCEYWSEGKCIQGAKCYYSHEGPGSDPRRSQLCQFFRSGRCSLGSSCDYSHDKSNFPCAFFHGKGRCRDQSTCTFSHEPMTEIQEAWLKEDQRKFDIKKSITPTN